MKSLCTILLSLSISFASFSQEFVVKENDKLWSRMKLIQSGLLNGKVIVKDIYYPDKNFECLKSLGEPEKVEESHSGVGDDYTFYYEDMFIFFSNIEEDELTLSLIEFTGSASFLRLSKLGIDFTANQPLTDYISSSALQGVKIHDGNILSIKFKDWDAAYIRIVKDDAGVIQNIRIYF
ncbi:MAG: hypothetical protein AAF391_05035 [Bacteroidota bacterium]